MSLASTALSKKAVSLLYLLSVVRCFDNIVESAEVVFNLKVGLYVNNFLSNGSVNYNSAQSLAGFLLAIDEINRSPILMPNVHMMVALRGGIGAYGAITAAQSFVTANFSVGADGLRVSNSMFIHDNPIGVDVILGAAKNTETLQLNQILDYFKIVQLHTVATASDLTYNMKYSYQVGVTPTTSFDGEALQYILCKYFGMKKIAIFATDDSDGQASIDEITAETYCRITVLAAETISSSSTDFTDQIENVISSGATVFVLFVPAVTAALILEQAYDLGMLSVGTQVIGNSLVTDSSLCANFKNPSNTKNIMRGFIGIKYSPKHNIHATAVGRNFVDRYRQQADTVTVSNSGILTCPDTRDDTREFLFKSQQPDIKGAVKECSGLQFSRFLPNGTNMFSYTAHAYDSVYAISQGITRILQEGGKNTINGDLLRSTIVGNVSLTGVTGALRFHQASAESLFFALGNREVGLTYYLYNFNDALYDSSDGAECFALVKNWSTESDFVVPCTDADYDATLGGPCISGFTYRTVGNVVPSDTPAEIDVDLPVTISHFLFAIGSIALLLITISLGIVIKFRKSRLIKASQPCVLYMIHGGCLLGGVRTIIGGLPYSDNSCRANFFLSHFVFCIIYSPFIAKIWRLQKIFNNKTLVRVKFPWRLIFIYTMSVVFTFSLFLMIATIVGNPHISRIPIINANRVTNTIFCDYQIIGFQTSLYILEGALILYSYFLIYKIADIPDPLDEIKFYTTG